LLFLVVLLINIDLIIVDFGSLLWMLDIIWRILFVKLSLLEKGVWLETNDRHLSLSINFTLFFLLHLVDLILWHFILPLHLD
jgi:tryptophan-rich sensory protein